MIIGAFGACLSNLIIYLTMTSNLFRDRFGEQSVLTNQVFLSLVISSVLIFFTCYKDITKFKNFGFIAFLTIYALGFLVLVDLFYSLWNGQIIDEDLNFFISKDETENIFPIIVNCISIIVLSFDFHIKITGIYGYLLKKNTKSMLTSSAIGISTSLLTYLLIGIILYVIYGSETNSGLLTMHDDSTIFIFMQICIIIFSLACFPQNFFGLLNFTCLKLEIIIVHIKLAVI